MATIYLVNNMKTGIEQIKELLEKMSDEEFLKLYKQCEKRIGQTVEEYYSNFLKMEEQQFKQFIGSKLENI